LLKQKRDVTAQMVDASGVGHFPPKISCLQVGRAAGSTTIPQKSLPFNALRAKPTRGTGMRFKPVKLISHSLIS
jgi:hypothetical protein